MSVSKRNLAILVLAAALILLTSVGVARAYFRDYERAWGYATLHLNGKTEIEEKVENGQKEVTIVNTGDANMIIRVKAFAPTDLQYGGEGWIQAGDYWYYNQVLTPKAESGVLDVSWEKVAANADNNKYEVIVVQEAEIAVYDEDGKLMAPEGWDAGAVSQIKAD